MRWTYGCTSQALSEEHSTIKAIKVYSDSELFELEIIQFEVKKKGGGGTLGCAKKQKKSPDQSHHWHVVVSIPQETSQKISGV